jgi:IMP dehydrogenase
MNRVSDILREKGSKVLDIDGAASVFDAIKRMVEANVGALLVRESGEVAGIITERDYLRRVTLEGRTEKTTQVREIMSSPLVYVTPESTVEECMALMTERRIRHAPVVAEDEVVGMISIGDLVKFQSKQHSFEVKYLRDYISGR